MTKQTEAMKLALEALESCTPGDWSTGHVVSPGYDEAGVEAAITALREALAEQPAQQEPIQCPICKAKDSPYFKCGCVTYVEQPAQQALDKMAENARELGLDYEPAQDSGIVTAGGFDPRTQRTWVGLTDEDIDYLCELAYENDEELILTVQAKLKEKNT